jgi:hypothetical protein
MASQSWQAKEQLMSVRHLLAEATTDSYALTGGRILSMVGGLVALAGLIAGGLALARPTGGRRTSVVALVAGLTGVAIGGTVVAVADGGPGSGSGIVGGFVALVIGLIATVLGWLAHARRTRHVRARVPS